MSEFILFTRVLCRVMDSRTWLERAFDRRHRARTSFFRLIFFCYTVVTASAGHDGLTWKTYCNLTLYPSPKPAKDERTCYGYECSRCGIGLVLICDFPLDLRSFCQSAHVVQISERHIKSRCTLLDLHLILPWIAHILLSSCSPLIC